METRSVVSSQLETGMRVHCHGGVFTITAIERYPDTCRDAHGVITRASSVFLADLPAPFGPCYIPLHWRDPVWIIQGNDLVQWTVERDEIAVPQRRVD